MIGPTGVGKTEIARRLAKLVGAPFIKVEATKFTEVGYVGRDVESMVRDLMETSIRVVKEEKMQEVKGQAEKLANQRLVELLVPSKKKTENFKNPFEMIFGNQNEESDQSTDAQEEMSTKEKRAAIAKKLAIGELEDHLVQVIGELEDHLVQVEVEEQQPSMFDMLQGSGMEQMGMSMQDGKMHLEV